MIFDTFVSQHPILTMFLYILLCIGLGIGIYVGYHTLRRNIQIRKNMKARVRNDKSN